MKTCIFDAADGQLIHGLDKAEVKEPVAVENVVPDWARDDRLVEAAAAASSSGEIQKQIQEQRLQILAYQEQAAFQQGKSDEAASRVLQIGEYYLRPSPGVILARPPSGNNGRRRRQEITYRPQAGLDGIPIKDPNIFAVVTIGFVNDAKDHIDVQGFNVYHKNQLIKGAIKAPWKREARLRASSAPGRVGIEPLTDTRVVAHPNRRCLQVKGLKLCLNSVQTMLILN
ncbi:hypothetical protein QJS10_CPA09g01105 [Acorus calamus]|uniref:Morc S5 domain-containing protein n=1 Tax=Acorus calamus TaxID=4465 RepID=A0AAV9E324_ACOCL|nr:hypothetical protein QJS10_CPA09g01105 [Acorus calamus]